MKIDPKTLIGKTIQNIVPMKLKHYDDTGFLKLSFTDGFQCVVVGGYLECALGNNFGEYPTRIHIEDETELEIEQLT